ncbi:MAG: iron-containing alcohol dehydrogenase [Pseudomonadota bacterium]
MQHPFSFRVPTQLRFGDGVSKEVVDVLPQSARHVAVLRGAVGAAAQPIIALLERHGVSVLQLTCGHEPSVASVNAAVQALSDKAIDAVVACGGGSVLDTGKAVAFCLGHDLNLTDAFGDTPTALLDKPGPLPLVAIPTTAGTGAEATANAVLDIPSQRAKVSLRGRGLYASYALIDPALLPSAPARTVLSSGLDAVVQTIEAYTSNAATPFSDALTEPNIALGLDALKTILASGDPEAWRAMAWVSTSSGVALANSGLGAVHGAASILGGQYGAPHGALCGRLLVPALRRNLARCETGSQAERRLRTCFASIAHVFAPISSQDELSGLEHWQDDQGLPRLAAFNVRAEAIPALAKASRAASSSKRNAVDLRAEDFQIIFQAAL